MAALAKRAQEVKEMETAATRPKAGTKAEQSLLDAAENRGKATEKARRDMTNLVAGKKRPEQVFVKWENTHCKSNLELMHLAKQIKQDPENHQQQHTEQLAKLVCREQRTKYLEDFSTHSAANREVELKKKEEAFTKEQYEWRLRRALTLGGEDLIAVEMKWTKVHEQSFRTQIWDEAKEANMAAARAHLISEHASNFQKKYESGRSAGREAGLKQGRVDTLREFKAQLDEAYTRGHTKGVEAQKAENSECVMQSYLHGRQSIWDHQQ
jgi:hypothetical protein